MKQQEKQEKRSSPRTRSEYINMLTNQIFDKYEKTFRDLARYDREERNNENNISD